MRLGHWEPEAQRDEGRVGQGLVLKLFNVDNARPVDTVRVEMDTERTHNDKVVW